MSIATSSSTRWKIALGAALLLTGVSLLTTTPGTSVRTGPTTTVPALPPHHSAPATRPVAEPSPGRMPAEASRGMRIEEQPVGRLIDQALHSAVAAERAAAVGAIVYAAPADDAVTVVVQALFDGDEQVRAAALDALKETSAEMPGDAVLAVLRVDPSPARRIQALELLVERATGPVVDTLRLALVDPEHSVRARAAELIEDQHVRLDGT